MSLTVDFKENGEEGVLYLSGRLDTNTAPEAEPEMYAAAERVSTLILDLSGLEYISSSGLRLIKRAYSAMEKKCGSLKLRDVTPSVKEVLDITGFSELLEFL